MKAKSKDRQVERKSKTVEEGDRVVYIGDIDYEQYPLKVMKKTDEKILMESGHLSLELTHEEFDQAVQNTEKSKTKGFPKIWTEEMIKCLQ